MFNNIKHDNISLDRGNLVNYSALGFNDDIMYIRSDPIIDKTHGLRKDFKLTRLTHICPICDKGFISKSKLDIHKRFHDDGYRCRRCDDTFDTKKLMFTHVRSVHHKKCTHCNSTFANDDALTKHMASHRSYKCTMRLSSSNGKSVICGKIFHTPHRLSRHHNTHTKPFSCDICGVKFGAKYYIVDHKRTVHSGNISFKCDICGRGFKDRSNLRRHNCLLYTSDAADE